MNDLLFAVPWWIPSLLALIGMALLLNGNRTQVVKVRNAGAALIALAVVWGSVSYLVDTDKEKVEKGTKRMIQSVVDGVASGDFKGFTSELAPDVHFTMGGASIDGAGNVTEIARGGAETVKLKSAQVRELTIEQNGPYITVHCDIFSTQESFAPIETSTWQFDWERTNQGWKVREMKLLKLKDVDQLDGTFPRRMLKSGQ